MVITRWRLTFHGEVEAAKLVAAERVGSTL